MSDENHHPFPLSSKDDPLDANLSRLVNAGLTGPARPLNPVQIQEIRQAAELHIIDRQISWEVAGMAFGLIILALGSLLFTGQNGYVLRFILLIPLVNLIFTPLAALVIILYRRKHYVEDKK